eukprot:tig00000881_g5230.t1
MLYNRLHTNIVRPDQTPRCPAAPRLVGARAAPRALVAQLLARQRERHALEHRYRARAQGPARGRLPRRSPQTPKVAPMTEKIRKLERPVAAQGCPITIRDLHRLALNRCVWALLKR